MATALLFTVGVSLMAFCNANPMDWEYRTHKRLVFWLKVLGSALILLSTITFAWEYPR
jgi:hypothetical protein